MMPSKSQVKKMPDGKMQFGIIVPVEIHTRAKHLAADKRIRISDVYAKGVKALADSESMSKVPKEIADSIEGVREEHFGLFKTLGAFLRNKPSPDKLEILQLVMGQHEGNSHN